MKTKIAEDLGRDGRRERAAQLQADVLAEYPYKSKHVDAALEATGAWWLERRIGPLKMRDGAANTPWSYRAAALLSDYVHLNAIAETWQGMLPQQHHGWLAFRTSDHEDSLIVGACAYASYLVTSDNALAERLRFLRERGRCFIQTATLDQWVRGEMPSPVRAPDSDEG